MKKEKKQIYVLYGSQTGNCEEISRFLYEDIDDYCVKNSSIQIELMYNSLNKFMETEAMDTLDKNTCIIIVTSTTGNGDMPDNAYKFWKHIKSREISVDLFLDVTYTVLALGDSNYDKFCNAGKLIYKRMKELSGKQLTPLYCVDEVGDMEEQIEDWKNKTMNELFQWIS